MKKVWQWEIYCSVEKYFSYFKEKKYNNGDRYYNNGNITIGYINRKRYNNEEKYNKREKMITGIHYSREEYYNRKRNYNGKEYDGDEYYNGEKWPSNGQKMITEKNI